MYRLTFLPFVGKQYIKGGIFGKRIMVLGDSHYGSEPDAMITNNVLGWYLDYSLKRVGWMNTFLKFERAMVGHTTNHNETLSIWNSLLFYNYLQVLLDGPREAGTKQQYKDSEAAFFEVLEKYQPDAIIVWGKRLWENIPWTRWTEYPTLKYSDGSMIDNGCYTLSNGHKVKVMCSYHPSVGYDWNYWAMIIAEFLKTV